MKISITQSKVILLNKEQESTMNIEHQNECAFMQDCAGVFRESVAQQRACGWQYCTAHLGKLLGVWILRYVGSFFCLFCFAFLPQWKKKKERAGMSTSENGMIVDKQPEREMGFNGQEFNELATHSSPNLRPLFVIKRYHSGVKAPQNSH